MINITDTLTQIIQRDDRAQLCQILDPIIRAGTEGDYWWLVSLAANMAAAYGRTEMLEVLISRGLDAKKPFHNGYCLLVTAAHAGHLETVQFLVRKGVSINVTSEHNVTPLIAASGMSYINREWQYESDLSQDSDERVQLIKFLLDSGSDINASDDSGMTSLMWASFWGYINVARTLVAYGSDLTLRNHAGETAKDIANAKGLVEIVRLLEHPLVPYN